MIKRLNDKVLNFFLFFPLLSLLLYIVPIIVASIKDTQLTKVNPVVHTKLGSIRGLAALAGDYSMFMGIPYAVVNKSNPFGASIPHSKFDNVYEANDDSAICPQVEEFNNTIVGTLDCLHLNIYVPSTANPGNLVPVLVYIYGGNYTLGFAGRFLFGPKYLVKQNILLVTFNYRLGPYGFMCLGTPEVPGNQGLKDQVSALKWIHSNIEAFGGNPNDVTICGNSAGGISADVHLMYTQEDLFSKIILESGSSLYPRFMMYEIDVTPPLKLAKHLGLKTDNVNEALSFLSKVDPGQLVAAGSELSLLINTLCVEKDFENVEKFITDYPINLKSLKVKNISILLGNNNDEYLSKYGFRSPEYFTTLEPQNGINDIVGYPFNFIDENFSQITKIIHQFYMGDEEISFKVRQGLTDFQSDFEFIHSMHRTVTKYLESGARTIYQYMFSYVGERNFARKLYNITTGGAGHADELGYLFDISYMNKNPKVEDQLIIDRMTTMWANFVKYGDPTPVTTKLLPVKWLPVTNDTRYYLEINTKMSMAKRYHNRRLAFWDLFYMCNERFQKGYRDKGA